MPMTNLLYVCAQCGQTGRNADEIQCHTSEVNYVCMVLHCALCAAPLGPVMQLLCLSTSSLATPGHMDTATCQLRLRRHTERRGDQERCGDHWPLTGDHAPPDTRVPSLYGALLCGEVLCYLLIPSS